MRHDVFEPNTPEREIVKGSIPQAKKVSNPSTPEVQSDGPEVHHGLACLSLKLKC